MVRAPRVILLVHNEPPNKTQTHVLFSTIANAWPMLVFILVTASLSGIIIWFLVSFFLCLFVFPLLKKLMEIEIFEKLKLA